MSTIVAALLAGTAAAGGAAIWAGSSTSKDIPKSLEEVKNDIQETQVGSEPESDSESDSESNNERQPITPIENTQQSSPKELTPPPSPISTEPPIAEQAPIEPPPTTTEPLSTNETPIVQGGGNKQDGGFGKPTWAPLNSGESLQSAIGLTKEQIGSTGSKLLSTIIGEKTPESIQLKLKSIDDQLRILKVQKFNTETNINNESTNFVEIRKDYLIALTNKTKFEKYSIYYDTEINKVLKPQSSQSSDMITLKTIIENKFPKTKDENGKFNFDEWRDNTFDALQNKDDDPKGIKPRQNENNSKIWWARIISSSPSKSNQQTNQPKNIESELNTLLDKKSKNTIELEDAIQSEQDKKPFYDEKLQEIKDLRLKLQDTNKKIKDLQETRKLVLVELTNYELPLPKGILNLFPKKQKPIQKPIQKPSFLPIGEERNKLFAQIKDIETQLKDIEEETNDEIDTQLNNNSNWKPKEDKSDRYAELVNKRLSLEKQRDNLILSLEGRSIEQKQLLQSYNEKKLSNTKFLKENQINPIELSKEANKKATQLKKDIEKSVEENRKKIEEESIETPKNILEQQSKSEKIHQCSNALSIVLNLLPNEEKGKKFNDIDEKYQIIIKNQLKNYGFTDEEIQECIDTNPELPLNKDREEIEEQNPFAQGGTKKQFLNHLTRRQWTRSKPSRFKTHRIY
jgi:hypothetical protein